MKKSFAAIIVVCLIAVMIVMLTGFVPPPLTEEEKLTLTEIGNKWVASNYRDQTEIGEILPVVNDEELIGYCIAFELENEPNGYLMLNLESGKSEIIEYALSGENPFELLVEYSGEEVENDAVENRYLYSPSPLVYGILVENEGRSEIYTSENEIIDEEETVRRVERLSKEISVKATATDIHDGIIDLPGGLTEFYYGNSLQGIDSFTPSLMTDFAKVSGEGNCGPTAMTNMLMYWKSRGYGKIDSAGIVYDKMVAYTGFNWERTKEGITIPKAVAAATKYMKGKGYKVSSFDYWGDPFSYFKNDIDNGHTVATLISVKESNGKILAHAVITVGWREHWNGYNPSKESRYLRVLDGWRRTTNRFVLFDDYYRSIEGTVFKVKG